jgi:hypothetical protein
MPTKPVRPESELRLLVQQRIKDRRLPIMRPAQIYAGHGSGTPCCVCDQPIERAKMEYEIPGPDAATRLKFHFACYVIWQQECSYPAGSW